MLQVFKHLLPRARAWDLTINKTLRSFFEGLVGPVLEDPREYLNLMWLDLFPETTRELSAWEQAFGFITQGQIESDRRDRLTAAWAAQGGQDPYYIQNTLRSAGFDVYVHEWWIPATDPPEPRNPFEALGTGYYCCGDPIIQCGENLAQCGAIQLSNGYMLVNKLYTADIGLTCCCGDTDMQCGEDLAECWQNVGSVFRRRFYAIPDDPTLWPYIIYIGGETFGDEASIPADRIDEFEDLVLKIIPAHLWVGLIVNYLDIIIDDWTLEPVLDDWTLDVLVAEV